MRERLQALLSGEPELAGRLLKLRDWSRRVRTSEYHLTNACNIRCKGCWFFEYDFDRGNQELRSLQGWKDFAARERQRGVTAALLIGGEPSLFADRVAAFVAAMPYVTISSNGLKPLPYEGFEDVNVALTLFGGGALDDDLRAHRPGGRGFSGLFDMALENYRNDDRVIFIYAVTPAGIELIEETTRRIRDNGNQLTFNYYSSYGSQDPLHREHGTQALLEECLRMKEVYPETVVGLRLRLFFHLLHRQDRVGRVRLRRLPQHQRRPPGPRRAQPQRQSDAAGLQHLRRRRQDGGVLLHLRSLRELPRQPGRLQLAAGEPQPLPGFEAAAAHLARHGRELLATVRLVALPQASRLPSRPELTIGSP
jgi:hypothetical protein